MHNISHHVTLFFAKNLAELFIFVSISLVIFLFSSFFLTPSKDLFVNDDDPSENHGFDPSFRADTCGKGGKNIALSAQEIIFEIQKNIEQANIVPISVSQVVSTKTIQCLVPPPAKEIPSVFSSVATGTKKNLHSVQRVTRRLAKL